jgi:hypothetical protein
MACADWEVAASLEERIIVLEHRLALIRRPPREGSGELAE